MNVSDLMEAMADAGAPMAAIILAVRALEEKDALIEARRAGDRERKRRQRGTVTGQSRDTDVTVTSEIPSLDKSPQTPKINPNPGTHTHETPARRASPWPCPEDVDPTHWRDFLTNRKHKRLVSTETARLGVMRSLAEIADDEWPPGRLVEHAAAKGWASINDPRESTGLRNGRPPTRTDRMAANDGLGLTTRAARDFLADHGELQQPYAGH